MDISEIQNILPHRFPFLLVDRVVSVEKDRLVAYKNVTINEPFFAGHFPGRPVMPGVLICEAMAQAAALLAFQTGDFEKDSKDIYLMGFDKVRFRRVVTAGDRLDLEAQTIRHKGDVWRHRVKATVDGERVAECTILAMIKDRE